MFFFFDRKIKSSFRNLTFQTNMQVQSDHPKQCSDDPTVIKNKHSEQRAHAYILFRSRHESMYNTN